MIEFLCRTAKAQITIFTNTSLKQSVDAISIILTSALADAA